MEKANVLILAMSTVPQKGFSKSTLENIDMTYYSQLEPVPLYITSDKGLNEEIDTIFVFTTPDTKKEVEIKLEDNKQSSKTYVDKGVYNVKRNKYKERINKLLRASDSNIEIINNTYDINNDSSSKDNILIMSAFDYFKLRMKENGINAEIIDIDIDEDNSSQGISNAVTMIRERIGLYHLEKRDCKLWVDIHGGYRDISLVYQAVIYLLKDGFDIDVDDIFTIQYGKKANIKSVKESFKIFDFVSGIEEFRNYGSSYKIKEYYGDKYATLLNSMSEVSEGIKYCDFSKYKKGVKELSKNLEEINGEDYLGIFKEYFDEDYKQAINSIDDESKLSISLIHRCFKYGLIQPALTFIEERTGYILYDLGYFRIVGALKENADIKKTYEDITKKLAKYFRDKPNQSPKEKLEELINKIEDPYESFNYYVKYRKLDKSDKSKGFVNNTYENDMRIEFKSSGYKLCLSFDYSQGMKTSKGLITNYENLKRERNKINHASGEEGKEIYKINNYICDFMNSIIDFYNQRNPDKEIDYHFKINNIINKSIKNNKK